MSSLTFELQHSDTASKARAGKITTDHGDILTPIFMPVGTVGSVKAVTQQQLLNDVKEYLSFIFKTRFGSAGKSRWFAPVQWLAQTDIDR